MNMCKFHGMHFPIRKKAFLKNNLLERHVIDVSNSIGEFMWRMKHEHDITPTEKQLNGYVELAAIDALSVLDALSTDEIIEVREDPSWGYLDGGGIHDPVEAFHFNLIEELTAYYIKASDRKEFMPASGFVIHKLPLVSFVF